MAGDDDKRPLLHGQRNGDRGGCAIAFGIRLIKERHTLEILLADLHHNGQQLVHAPVLAHGKQRLCQKAVRFLVGIAQHHGVMGIGRHAAHAKEDQGFETADILLRAPELLHIVIVGSAAGGSTDGAVRNESRLFSMHPVDQSADGFFIKIHIGNGGEQSLDHQPPCIPVHIRGVIGGTRQPPARRSARPEASPHRRSCRIPPLFPCSRYRAPSAHTENRTFCCPLKILLFLVACLFMRIIL